MRFLWFKIVLLLSLGLLGRFAFADTLTIDATQGRYPLGLVLEFLEDKNKSYSIEAITSGKLDSLFVKSEFVNPNFGMTGSAYWARFTVSNQAARHNNFLLEIEYPFLDRIDVYFNEDDQWLAEYSGDTFPFDHREIKNRLFLFSLYVQPWQTETFYIRAESLNGSIQLPATLWKPIAFDEKNHNLQFFFGLIYGSILLIIVSNAFLFFTTKDSSYLHYIFAMTSSLILLTTFNGHAFEYIWSESIWLQNNIFPILISSVSFWMSVFCRKFLDTKNFLPTIDLFLYRMLFLQGGSIVSFFFISYNFAVILSTAISTVSFLLLLTAGIWAISRRVQASQLFLAAITFYLVGLVVYVLKSFNFVPLNFFTEYSVQIGAATQVTLISFALGIKLKHLQKERGRAQKEALRLQQEVTERLEQKVLERTTEINQKAGELEGAYRNLSILSRIGRDITSTLDMEEVFTKLYDYVKELMDASIFAIDIYHPEKEQIEYRFNIENGEKLPVITVSIHAENNLSAWAIKNKRAIFMNDLANEIHKYVDRVETLIGQEAASVIYIPLQIGETVLGIITVQSLRTHAYNQSHLEMMKSLAAYTAIAVDHAAAYSTITNANKHIVQSIQYARRIQEAILPADREIKTNFEESFILYKPRDIVSGDFYWFAKKEDCRVIAVVDCTGHGVPGAFMTMMGNDLLNQIVYENNVTSPEAILNRLDKRVRRTLNQAGSDTQRNDGMDISICVIDDDNKILSFAGAKQSICYVHRNKDQFEEIKGSPFPIGSSQIRKEKIFTKHEIHFEYGDMIYLFTDGYQDQFGGKNNTKYLSKRFRQFLSEIHAKNFEEQRTALDQEIETWRGGHAQTDDILVVGLML